MFWKEHARYVVGILIAILLVVLVFMLIFKSVSNKEAGSGANSKKTMTQYIDTDAAMVMTAEGPIVSNQKYQSVSISVDQYQVKINIMSGYQNAVVASQTYTNNHQSFDEFVRALSIQGYDKGDNSELVSNEAGYCPTGVRYVMAIEENNENQQRYWKGTCGVGTFHGNTSQVVNLFKQQVPDFTSYIQSQKVTFSF